MKLTIIPSTGSVGENELFYNNLDLSSCNIPSDIHALQWENVAGWIEFKDPIPNQEITSLPTWANCCMVKWDEANQPPPPPPPPTADENKQTASNKLYKTDWTTIPDVADQTKSNPYLSNVEDFVNYRNSVRQYAVYPVAGNINWPTEPQAIWVKI